MTKRCKKCSQKHEHNVKECKDEPKEENPRPLSESPNKSCDKRCDKTCDENQYDGLIEFKVTFPGDKCPRKPDFIICGAGMAACALARKLTDQNYRVLILELGKDQRDNPVVEFPFASSLYRGQGPIQNNFFNASYDPEYNSFLSNPDVPGDQSALIPVWASHAVGGGGVHWFTVWYRPDNVVLDGPLPAAFVPNTNTAAFAEAGGPQWASKVINPQLIGLENFRLPFYLGNTPGYTENPAFRGFSGPESIIQLQFWDSETCLPADPDLLNFNLALSNAAPTVQGGAPAPIVCDYNNVQSNTTLNSTSQFQFALDGNTFQKQNTYQALLYDVVETLPDGSVVGKDGRPLVILTERQVVKVLKDKKKSKKCFTASGVQFQYNNLNYFVKGKNVVNSMGACYGPLMWQRSGIGPNDVLAKAGIPLEVNSPFIGQNLTEHFGPLLKVVSDNPAFSNLVRDFPVLSNIQYNGVPRRWQLFMTEFGYQTSKVIDGGSVKENDNCINQFNLAATLLNARSRGYINQIRSFIGTNTTDLQWGFFSDGPNPFDASSGLYNPPNPAFTGFIDNDTLFVSDVIVGGIVPGNGLILTSNGLPCGITVLSQIDGVPGGEGSYLIDPPLGPGFTLGPTSVTIINPANVNLVNNDSDIATACAAADYAYQVLQNLRSFYPAANFRLTNFPESVFDARPREIRYPEMVQWITTYLYAQSHDCSTVVMNNDPKRGAVDGHLKLHGTSNCFHCDKAIFPVNSSGNPGALVQAVGLNAGNVIPPVARL